MEMKIALGSDHGGYELKETIQNWLEAHGYKTEDFGTYNTQSCDYSDYAALVAEAIITGNARFGILVCGTGIGMSIAANKVQGIRAALCHECFSAKMSRAHNDANILCLGQRVTGSGLALEIVETWLKSEFEGGRHQRRVDKVAALEQA